MAAYSRAYSDIVREMRALFAVAAVGWAAGCDSRATASDPPTSRADQRSREYESCSTSSECQDELRCVEQACRRLARSTVADYHATAGAGLRERGELVAAVATYAQAVRQYDLDKLALPPDVDCGYGGALAAARANKEHAELGARVLHRCLLVVPAGSRLRSKALADLALLGDAGLDPALLAGGKLADRYLTRAPARPATDKLAVTVAATPTPTAKSYPVISEKLADAEVRGALVACWEAHNAATHKPQLTATIALKVSYVASEYDDEPGSFAVKFEPPAPGLTSPEAAADACVRQVVEPAIKGLRLTDGFATRLAVTIK